MADNAKQFIGDEAISLDDGCDLLAHAERERHKLVAMDATDRFFNFECRSSLHDRETLSGRE